MINSVGRFLRLRLVRNVAALYGVKAVDQLLPILVLPFLARVLGPEGWGLVAGAQALAIYGIVIITYGFELTGPRAVAIDRDDEGRLAELVSGVLATQLMLAGVVALTAVLVLLAVPAFQGQPELIWSALAFAVLQGFSPLWFFVGQERVPLVAVIGAGAKVIGTVAIFALVRGPEDGWLVLACYAGAAGIATCSGYALMLRRIRPSLPRIGHVARTLKLSAVLFANRIAGLMTTQGNSLLLLLLGGPAQVAFFAGGEKLCRPVAWLLEPINVALMPRLSQLVARAPEQARAMASLSMILMTWTGCLLGLVVWNLAPSLVDLLFGLPEYQPAISVLRVMAVMIPLIVLNAALVSQWIIPHGLERGLLAVTASSMVINLALVLALAPIYGALGVAWIAVIAESYVLAGLLLVLHWNGLRPALWRESHG